jgi:ABC-2 type transport system permease protein
MRILAIAKRVLVELVRDKRTLALMFLAPLLVLTLMNYVFTVNTTTEVTIGVVNVPQQVVKNLDDTKHVSVKEYNSESELNKALTREKIDSTIRVADNTYYVTYANTDVAKTTLAKAALQSALVKAKVSGLAGALHAVEAKLPQTSLKAQKNTTAMPQVKATYNYGTANSTFFDKMMPILMGFFVFFFVYLISGMALLKERTSGTLERLLATPVRRSDIVFGYLVSYGLIAVLQTLLIVAFTVLVLHVEVAGSIWLVLLTTVLLALVALALGIFMSTFAQSEFQMMQFIPLIVVPQIFFSGLISLSAMAPWAQWLANILPMKYAASALTDIILKGAGFGDVVGNLLALIVFTVILTVGNIVGLKRYRKA